MENSNTLILDSKILHDKVIPEKTNKNSLKEINFKLFELRNTCKWKLLNNFETFSIKKLKIECKKNDEQIPFGCISLLKIQQTYLWANTLKFQERKMKSCQEIKFTLKVYYDLNNNINQKYEFTKKYDLFASNTINCALIVLIDDELVANFIKDHDEEFYSSLNNYVINDDFNSDFGDNFFSSENDLESSKYTLMNPDENSLNYHNRFSFVVKSNFVSNSLDKIFSLGSAEIEDEHPDEFDSLFQALEKFFENYVKCLSDLYFDPFVALFSEKNKNICDLKIIKSK